MSASQQTKREEMSEWMRFIRAETHILHERPDLFFQQAANQPDSTAPARAARSRFESGLETRPWLRRINKPQGGSACLMTLSGHTGEVTACAVSPDGSLVASASKDGSLRLWSADTGAQIAMLDGYICCAFSPDGQTIAAGSWQSLPVLWEGIPMLKIRDVETGSELFSLPGHPESLDACAFSADGTRIVSHSDDGTVKLWDAETGEMISSLGAGSKSAASPDGKRILLWLYGTPKLINTSDTVGPLTLGELIAIECAAFSSDGTKIVSGIVDGTLKIWDAETGAELKTLRGHARSASVCNFSLDGARIVSASGDEVKIWDARSGQELLTLTDTETHVGSCAFSPDGTHLAASGLWDEELKIWDSRTGEAAAILPCRKNLSQAWGFSPDGRRLAVASSDESVTVWDTSTWAETESKLPRLPSVWGCAFSPDGARIFTASEENTLTVCDVASGEKLSEICWGKGCARSSDGGMIARAKGNDLILSDALTGAQQTILKGHIGAVRACAFSPDGDVVASGSYDQTVKVWESASGKMLTSLEGHTGEIKHIAFFPDGNRIVSASSEGTLKVWDWRVVSDDSAWNGYSHTAWGVQACSYSPDGKQIATASWDKKLRLWDAETGECRATLTGHRKFLWDCAYSPDGSRIVSGSADMSLSVWDAMTGAELMILDEHHNEVRTCAFSIDGKRIVSVAKDSTLIVWDAITGKRIVKKMRPRRAPYQSDGCAISPDGSRVALCFPDSTMRIVNGATGAMVARIKAGHRVYSLSFSPDSRRVVAGSWEGDIDVWSAINGKLLARMDARTGQVAVCRFSPDGTRIVSASDNILRIWDAQTGAEKVVLTGHRKQVLDCCFTADGAYVISTSLDNTLRVWDASSGRPVCDFLMDCEPSSVKASPDARCIAIGSARASLYLFEPENLPRGAPVVTAWRKERQRFFLLREAEPDVHIRCPFCGGWYGLSANSLGGKSDCPLCSGSVKLNLFTFNGDWPQRHEK